MGNITHGGVYPVPAQEQPCRYGRREGGRFTVVPYESPSSSEIDALATQADIAGLNYEVTKSFGKSRLEIEYNWNNRVGGLQGQTVEAEETWEIVPGKQSKDLLDSSNPLVRSALGEGNGFQEVNALKGWQRQNILESKITDGNGLFVVPTISIGGSAVSFNKWGIILAKYLYDGVSQCEVDIPTLTHSKVVTAQYIYPAQFLNVGKIISTATLISSEGVPTTVLFDFPADVDPAPIAIGSTGFTQSFLYGWKKGSPTVRQVSKKKWNITQGWDYGLWGIELFGGTRL